VSKLRQGDLKLYTDLDGGVITVTNGEPEMDGGFETALFLSIEAEEGDGSDFWMNEYFTESQKIKSDFMAFIKAMPKTLANINQATELLKSDLNWFIVEGIADEVTVSIDSVDRNRIEPHIVILADGEKIIENIWEINWGFQENSPGSSRV
jgi:hypothetical protein